jgi:hypothetical protein
MVNNRCRTASRICIASFIAVFTHEQLQATITDTIQAQRTNLEEFKKQITELETELTNADTTAKNMVIKGLDDAVAQANDGLNRIKNSLANFTPLMKFAARLVCLGRLAPTLTWLSSDTESPVVILTELLDHLAERGL